MKTELALKLGALLENPVTSWWVTVLISLSALIIFYHLGALQ